MIELTAKQPPQPEPPPNATAIVQAQASATVPPGEPETPKPASSPPPAQAPQEASQDEAITRDNTEAAVSEGILEEGLLRLRLMRRRPLRGESQPQSSPLNGLAWEQLLSRHPPDEDTRIALQSINQGADIQYDGPRAGATESSNLSSARLHPEAVDTFFDKELKAGRIEGPFDSPPLPNLRIAPLGTVPKDETDFRVIVHYSFPEGGSINDHTIKLECDLQSFDDAMRLVAGLPRGTRLIKMDVKSAFRLVAVREADHHLLGMKWRNKYFYDKHLPFGLAASPPLWERISRMINWIMRVEFGLRHVMHYVDDFLVAVPPDQDLQKTLELIRGIWGVLGVPVAEDKLEIGTSLTYLGLELDTVARCARVPQVKLDKAREILSKMAAYKEVRAKWLESAVGKLAFLGKVFPVGKPFLSELRRAAREATDGIAAMSPEAKAEVRFWRKFLPSWSGVALLRDPIPVSSEDLHFYTDASGSAMGAVLGTEWIYLPWTEDITDMPVANNAPPIWSCWPSLLPFGHGAAIFGASM